MSATRNKAAKQAALFSGLMLVGLSLLFSPAAYAEQSSIASVAGPLQLEHAEGSTECLLQLAQTPLLTIDCEAAYLPTVIGNFTGSFAGMQQILVLQESPMGNACNGGTLHIMALGRDKRYRLEEIEFCGGKDPVLQKQGDTILITLPGGPLNHGPGIRPTERWAYRNGRLLKLR